MIKDFLKKSFVVLLFIAASNGISFSQDKAITCADIKTGIFHLYPKNSSDHYVDIREDELLKEAKVNSTDTSFYKIKWLNDCTFSMQYLSGTEKMTDEMLKFFKKHKLVSEISSITNEYYIYKAYIDKPSNLSFATDTVWYNEKTTVADNTIYKQVSLTEAKIKDTSGYALLYIYRPGKLTNSLADYLIYLNDNAMCLAKNKSGYIFKVFKEGKYQLKSRLFKDESAVDVDIKHGQTYYIKSMIHWGIKSHLYNFKLEMAEVTNEVGKAEFQEVRLQQAE